MSRDSITCPANNRLAATTFASDAELRDFFARPWIQATARADHLQAIARKYRELVNRDDDPALLDLFLLEPLHQEPIVQRTNLHTLPLLLRWTSPGRCSVTKSRLDLVTRGVRFTFLDRVPFYSGSS